MSRGPGPSDPLLPPWDELPDDERDAVASRRPAVPGGTFGVRIRGVSEVVRALRDHVRSDDGLRDLWVEGEIGRVTVSTAGHAYFSLKDARAQLGCVWFRDDRVRSPFQAQAGLQVLVHGRMDLFEPQGALQLYVEALQPAGVGNLALRFEQTKARLSAEGLFDAARKRRLPPRPRTIALVTSPTGAVWRDVCTVLARRWPLVRVVLVPCQVQGDTAPSSIVAALRRLEQHVAAEAAAGREADAPAVTIVARGGGSLEDLWAFNDERVVRAIAAHPVPVVAGIGHETDVTLADFVADVRAPTPSAAAELVVPDRVEVTAGIRATGRRAGVATARGTGTRRRALDAERRVLAGLRPEAQLAASRERVGLLLDRAARVVDARLAGDARRLDMLAGRPGRVIRARLVASASGLAATAASLAALGPESTLRRGYAIVRRAGDGRILREPGEAPAGEHLLVALAGGGLAATSDGPTGEGSAAS